MWYPDVTKGTASLFCTTSISARRSQQALNRGLNCFPGFTLQRCDEGEQPPPAKSITSTHPGAALCDVLAATQMPAAESV